MKLLLFVMTVIYSLIFFSEVSAQEYYGERIGSDSLNTHLESCYQIIKKNGSDTDTIYQCGRLSRYDEFYLRDNYIYELYVVNRIGALFSKSFNLRISRINNDSVVFVNNLFLGEHITIEEFETVFKDSVLTLNFVGHKVQVDLPQQTFRIMTNTSIPYLTRFHYFDSLSKSMDDPPKELAVVNTYKKSYSFEGRVYDFVAQNTDQYSWNCYINIYESTDDTLILKKEVQLGIYETIDSVEADFQDSFLIVNFEMMSVVVNLKDQIFNIATFEDRRYLDKFVRKYKW